VIVGAGVEVDVYEVVHLLIKIVPRCAAMLREVMPCLHFSF